MKKKNVLLLINQLYGGGAQKVIATLSIHLSERYNVILAIYNDLDKVVFEYSGELVKINLPYPEDTHNNSLAQRIARSFSLVKQVRKLKKKRNIDVCISFMEASNIANVLSGGKCKKILSVRSYLSHEFRDIPRLKVFKSFIHFLYNRSNHVVVPSYLLKKDLADNFGVAENKISVVYNFVDQDQVQIFKQEPIPAHQEAIFAKFPTIINVGRITNPKSQWLLMPVIASVKKQVPATKLVILGEGPLLPKMLDFAQKENLRVYQEGISDPLSILNFDIYILGFIKNPYPYLFRSHLFISSSVYEGFPNVIIEAMSAGLPIISTDCASGPREILSPASNIMNTSTTTEFAEYGVLTPVGDGDENNQQNYISEASSAVITLLSDEERRSQYKKQSLLRVKSFERKKIIDEWITLIDQ